MENLNEKKNSQDLDGSKYFLHKDPNRDGPTKSHKSYLGLSIPEDYFIKSKNEILAAVDHKKQTAHRPVFAIRPAYKWAIAASIAILLASGAFLLFQKPISTPDIELTDALQSMPEDESLENVLIRSLFVDDSEIDQFVDQFMVNTLINDVAYLKAEEVFINSLMLDDHEIDQYLDDFLLEEMIF